MSEERLPITQTIERLKAAKLNEYEHGGGRLYFEDASGGRDLIADFYGEGHYRDFIMRLIHEAVAMEPPLGPSKALPEVDRSIPWNQGGKESFLGASGMSMTHDELAAELGPAYQQIQDAGFVLVPKIIRERWWEAARQKTQAASLAKERDKAVQTLMAAGYTDCGGEYWKPPLGKNPLPEVDRLRRIISNARQWAESILPRPGPYHPAVAALFEEDMRQ